MEGILSLLHYHPAEMSSGSTSRFHLNTINRKHFAICGENIPTGEDARSNWNGTESDRLTDTRRSNSGIQLRLQHLLESLRFVSVRGSFQATWPDILVMRACGSGHCWHVNTFKRSHKYTLSKTLGVPEHKTCDCTRSHLLPWIRREQENSPLIVMAATIFPDSEPGTKHFLSVFNRKSALTFAKEHWDRSSSTEDLPNPSELCLIAFCFSREHKLSPSSYFNPYWPWNKGFIIKNKLLY